MLNQKILPDFFWGGLSKQREAKAWHVPVEVREFIERKSDAGHLRARQKHRRIGIQDDQGKDGKGQVPGPLSNCAF